MMATTGRRRTSGHATPSEASTPRWAGPKPVPAGAPRCLQRRRRRPAAPPSRSERPARILTRSPTGSVSSTLTTASAPAGSGAPVMILIAVPGGDPTGRHRAGGNVLEHRRVRPGRRRRRLPGRRNRPSPSWRTAAGRGRPRLSAASTSPSASRRAIACTGSCDMRRAPLPAPRRAASRARQRIDRHARTLRSLPEKIRLMLAPWRAITRTAAAPAHDQRGPPCAEDGEPRDVEHHRHQRRDRGGLGGRRRRRPSRRRAPDRTPAASQRAAPRAVATPRPPWNRCQTGKHVTEHCRKAGSKPDGLADHAPIAGCGHTLERGRRRAPTRPPSCRAFETRSRFRGSRCPARRCRCP